MSHSGPPLADDPNSNYIHYEDTSDIRPNDQIRVGSDNVTNFYEILTIRENDEIHTYDHETGDYDMFTKEEFGDILQDENTFKWSILQREIIPIDDANESLLVYIYAAEFPAVDDNRVLLTGWSIEGGQPPESVDEFTKLGKFLTFEDMRDAIDKGSDCFGELFETLSGDLREVLDHTAVSAEYNAQSLLGLQTDPTYDDEMKRRLDREAQHIDEMSKQYESIYR